MEEVEAGLRRLNNGRSGALLGYTSELLRYGKHPVSEEVPVPEHLLAPCITALFNMLAAQALYQMLGAPPLSPPFSKGGIQQIPTTTDP